MWKNRVQSTSNGSKTSGQSKGTNYAILSPFASHSTADSAASPSISPKIGSELPSGVRYIRQTPNSVYRPLTARSSATVTKKRDKSPEKNLRFAEPLHCSRSHEKTNAVAKPALKTRSISRERDRSLVRPVISAEPSPTECKRFSNHNHKVVATSPATRQTSPIFSVVDFGGDTNRNITSRKSPTVNPTPKPRNAFQNDLTPVATIPKSNNERQPVIKTEIMTPNGTVKRSSAVTTNIGSNGTIHRNTMSFPMQASKDRNVEPSRLSVNVNVAVGIDCNDCNDNGMNRFVDQRYSNGLSPQSEAIHIGEDEVDWMPPQSSGKGFALNVAIRLRPFVKSEIDSKNDIPVIEMNGNTVRIYNSDNEIYNRQEFGFDVCLNSSDKDLFEYADQDMVFKKMGEPLLGRALEGYNVCLFAYGQTGSGKSFTMTGTDSNPGIIPRFVHELYKRMSSLTEVLFAVEVSYCEIYNEKIYDLLSDDKNYDKKVLRIREHPQSGPYVENLTQHNVEDFDEVMRLLRNGNKRRATASTGANADSSRSHSIFTIVLSQLKNTSDEMGFDVSCSCGSRINLIDLAGSERIGHSGTSGDRMKEGTLINKSLLNLGKVISKLADFSINPSKSLHIPYRDSALTWLLKESLGGNSQTSMIATISPAKCYLEETLSTLRYAATARRIVNFVHINEDPKTKKIRELMEIISDLRAKQRLQAIDSNNESSKGTSSSDNSKNSSFESQISQKTVEKAEIGTNTSFVVERPISSTKGTETSFSQPLPKDVKKKKTATIATNTSFVKTLKSTGTETPPIKPEPKPKTVSTATEMSFCEPSQVDTSTNTSFVELPSRFDLLRFQKLEEQEQRLLEDIRKHREKILKEVSSKVEEWTPIGSGKYRSGEASGSDTPTSLDNYYDAEEVLETESMHSNSTYVVNETTVGHSSVFTATTPKQFVQSSTDMTSSKKKNKKKKDKTKDNEWKTEDNKNESKDKSNLWTQKDDWNNKTEQNKVVVSNHVSKENENTGDDWTDEQKTITEDKVDNEWSVDTNQTDVNKTDDTNQEWGTDTNDKTAVQSSEWQTGGDNEWGTNDDNKCEDNQWSQNDNQSTEQTQSQDNNTGNDWNEWSEEPKKSDKKQSSDKKKDKKKNKNKDKSDANDWGTDDNKTEQKSNEWQPEDSWGDKSEQNKDVSSDKTEAKAEDNQWGDDWGTDSGNKSEDKPQEDGGNDWTEGTNDGNDWTEDTNDGNNWTEDTNDSNNQTNDNQFDWGADASDNTVIDTKGSANDEVDDNW